jgi:chromosome partitioning protein
MRIEPFPVPRIGVLMNKAKPSTTPNLRKFSKETMRYWDDVLGIADQISKTENLKVRCFDEMIPDKVAIKRAIQEGIPYDLQQPFKNLWKEVETFVNEPK